MNNKTLISELRKSKGWTQDHLAEESGLSIRTIQRLEAGDDASLDTLRLVAEALNVSINELFETVEDPKKQKEITHFTQEQTIQINQRQADEHLFRIIKLLYFVLMLVIAAFLSQIPESSQDIFGTLWLAFFLIGFAVLKYIKTSWWANKLDVKYPLTKALLRTNKTNHGNFFWWNNRIARPILMVFWGAVIPLLFILKYALHLF